MCRIVHKPQGKSIGNGFMQLKSNAGHASGSNCGSNASTSSSSTSSSSSSTSYAAAGAGVGVGGNSLTANGTRNTLTTSTSYGSLSSSAAAAYQLQQSAMAAAAATAGDAEQPQNFMEFQGPITGLVYLLKDPKDPLLHIYLFECETIEEVSWKLFHEYQYINVYRKAFKSKSFKCNCYII